jgi:osmotically-inducible protein OsmY
VSGISWRIAAGLAAIAMTVTFVGVKHASASELSADQIRAAVVADLEDSESLDPEQVKVQVDNGIVTLSGTVASLMEKRRAATMAKRIRDVLGVDNKLIVQPPTRSDAAIRDDVEMRLKTNDSLHRKDIVIAVERATVAMTGRVESLAEKRLAEIAAAGVVGVMDVDNQLTVGLDPDRSDRGIKEEIKGLILNSVYLDDVEIDVKVSDAKVSLSGTVGSAEQRDRLKQIAGIWGVQSVDVSDVTIDSDRIGAKQRAARFADVSDATIAEAVERVLRNDPVVFVAEDAIKIDVASGVVTLDGTVRRLQTKQRAERLAMDIVGVVHVNNDLTVEPGNGKPDDDTIIRLTQEALKRSVYLERRDIRVHCGRGHVSLYGAVDSELEKKVAGWIAGGVPGVLHVNNALAVETQWEPKSDKQIAEDLRRKLETVLFEASDQIDVTVSNGVAVMTGTVDTWRQWQTALDLAIEAGSRAPHNMIDVRYHPPHGASRIFVPR